MRYFTKIASKFDIMKLLKKNPKLGDMSVDEAQQFSTALNELKMLDDLGNMHPEMFKYLRTSPEASKAVADMGCKVALASFKADNLVAEMEADAYLSKMGIAKKRKQNFGPSGQQVNGTSVDSGSKSVDSIPNDPVTDPAKPEKPVDNGGISDPEQPKPDTGPTKPDVTPGKSMNQSWTGTLANAMSSGKAVATSNTVSPDPKPVASGGSTNV